MITKSIIIAALSVGTVGGGGIALQPTGLELAAGPVRIDANGETGFSASMDSASENRLTIVLKNDTRLTLKL